MPSGKQNEWGDDFIIHRQDKLYRIPSELINEMFTSIIFNEGQGKWTIHIVQIYYIAIPID